MSAGGPRRHRGPGFPSTATRLASTAWRFAPARYENRPVEVCHAMTVDFEVR